MTAALVATWTLVGVLVVAAGVRELVARRRRRRRMPPIPPKSLERLEESEWR